MTTYAFRDEKGDVILLAPEFGRPIPVHAQQAGALEAVEAMRRISARRFDVDAEIANLVTKRLVKKRPRDLPTVRRIAEEHGWTVKEYESETGHALQGRLGDLGFRATWQYGKTTGATWHERAPRWALVADNRPVGVNALTRTGLKGKRSAGMGTTRLELLAAPWGIPLNVTTLIERLEAS